MNEDFYFRQPGPIKTQHKHRTAEKENKKNKKDKTHTTHLYKKTI